MSKMSPQKKGWKNNQYLGLGNQVSLSRSLATATTPLAPLQVLSNKATTSTISITEQLQ